ncbi:MAG: hypothetical protein ACREKL_00320, partial [Chthoniobacterales bacterium]
MKAKIPSLLVLSAAGILMLSGSAIAQIIAYDPFVIGADPANGEYSAGPIVTQDPTVTGWNLPWFESFPSTSA